MHIGLHILQLWIGNFTNLLTEVERQGDAEIPAGPSLMLCSSMVSCAA